MKNLSNWRSVRLLESRLEHDLRQRHVFWLHGLFIGLVTLGLTWGASHAQMLLGVESLALRYLVSLGLGYLGYLLMLRLWAGALVRQHRQRDGWGNLDGGWPGGEGGGGSGSASARLPSLRSGEGGDFGGGGASGDFSGAVDAPGILESADAAGGAGKMVSGALEAAGSADEAAVVVVPVVAIFLIGCAVFFGAGSLVLMYFGWEALLAVAVELAFSYVSARVAVRVVREGWLSAALRLTWKPLLGAVLCAVLLGATVDHFVPAAHSLPQALRLVSGPAR
ncbi:hypothetical protein [Polaromonas naphthalenivorans]|uniref:Transmembrane protein n=1 Tax=Polaromonas naphthalenivorans (strain CJ2) TaxID=365044 RepID=A1VIH9_POLNA|nr:hypothetical protein [Polaromonas naphthalenivorans]ABM35457.1 hypothetical protein Pnap_0132 [Polaromonas naphthalenivorans CJ2]